MTGVLLVLYGAMSHRKIAFLAASAVAVTIAVYFLYYRQISPWITAECNHYRPDFSFQDLSFSVLFAEPIQYSRDATYLTLDTTRFLLGNPSRLVAFAVLGLVTVFLYLQGTSRALFIGNSCEDKTNSPRQSAVASARLVAPFLFVIMLIMIVIMNALMILRHPPILWTDVRRMYYWVPATVMILLAIAVILGGAQGWRRVTLRLALCVALIGNILALPVHQQILAHGHLRQNIAQGPELLRQLGSLVDPTGAVDTAANADPLYQYFATRFHGTQP
jgi:hypothetical protein